MEKPINDCAYRLAKMTMAKRQYQKGDTKIFLPWCKINHFACKSSLRLHIISAKHKCKCNFQSSLYIWDGILFVPASYYKIVPPSEKRYLFALAAFLFSLWQLSVLLLFFGLSYPVCFPWFHILEHPTPITYFHYTGSGMHAKYLFLLSAILICTKREKERGVQRYTIS